MVNRPPHEEHEAPFDEREYQRGRPRPQDRPHDRQARGVEADRRYVNDGQYLNQGYYEEVGQDEFGAAEVEIGVTPPEALDGSGYLRPEFVQGTEYQQHHEESVGVLTAGEVPPNQMVEEAPAQVVGAITTFGNQEKPVVDAPNKLSPIIPRGTIIGKSILFIIIAMCFLASLSIVSLLLVQSSVDGWTADIGKQATVQIIPSLERDVDADVATALEIIRATNGVAQAEALSKNETGKLLEPWIGDGIIGKDADNNDISILDELPIPALIAIEFAPDQEVNLNLLDISLKAAIPGISVDDHKKWLSHLSSIGSILKISAFAVLFLVIGITISIIVFATDAALNSNKSSIEILFLVGAEESFITKEVRYHFLWLGLKAGAIGAIICIGFILLIGLLINIIYAAQFDNLAAARILFGQITLSPYQYLYLLLVPIFATIIAGVTVHLSAKRIINRMH
ncbi:MAG: hypothetical protein COB24_14460 [Hyphomicrobiales bacterium]|nr:MAG: hypothetical protein COB24_14460 [Hyphomicrobiales bacterium]